MKNVLIDLERLKYPHCGLGQVCLNLGKTWGERLSNKIYPHLLVPSNFSGKFGNKFVNYSNANPIKRHLPWTGKRFDLWHSIHQDPTYLPSSKNTPWIMTVLDLNFMGEKSNKKAQTRLEKLQKKIDRMDHLSAISNFTKSEMQKHLDLGGRDVEVIDLGIDHLINSNTSKEITVQPSFIKNKNFIFALGVVRPKKNFHVLVEMLSRLDSNNLDLVIAGIPDPEYAKKILALAEKFQVSARIILPGSINDQERRWCFENCQAFAFPSLFEGFGMPILEAMTFGKPVFSSDKTSLPEVGGDAAYYWKDFHPDAMAEVFQNGMQDFASRPNRPEEVKNWAAKYTWQNTVDQFEDIYLRVLSQN